MICYEYPIKYIAKQQESKNKREKIILKNWSWKYTLKTFFFVKD